MPELENLLQEASVTYFPDELPPFGVVGRRAQRRRTRIRLEVLGAALTTLGVVAAATLLGSETAGHRRLPVASDWTKSGSDYVMAVKGDPVWAGVAFGHRVAWVQAPKPPDTGLTGAIRIGTPGARLIHVHDLETGRDWSLAARTPTGTIADITGDGDKVVTTEVIDASGCARKVGFCVTWMLTVYDLKTGDVATLYRQDVPSGFVGAPVLGAGFAAWLTAGELHYDSLAQGPDGLTTGAGGTLSGRFVEGSLSIADGYVYFQRAVDHRSLLRLALPSPGSNGSRSALQPETAATDTNIGSPTVTADGTMAWTTGQCCSTRMQLRWAKVGAPGHVSTALSSEDIYLIRGGDGWILVDDLEGPQLLSTGGAISQLTSGQDSVSPRNRIVGKTLFFATDDDPNNPGSAITLHVRFLP
ncbi:MAG: hypothetical protein QOJ92_1079 [Frankiales bacterium]|jgi:hypothetical protein|nr:hypothetical protein [Frankiales bacterium]